MAKCNYPVTRWAFSTNEYSINLFVDATTTTCSLDFADGLLESISIKS